MTHRTKHAAVLVAALALLAALLALPATAAAQPARNGEPDPTVDGSGALWARGTGDVEIDMRGRLTARVDGDVTIVDHAGDLRGHFRFAGDRQAGADEAIGDMTLSDFDGEMHLRGSNFSVVIDQGDVLLRAVGRGEATLTGDGTYKTRNGERTAWDGQVVLGDPQIQPV